MKPSKAWRLSCLVVTSLAVCGWSFVGHSALAADGGVAKKSAAKKGAKSATDDGGGDELLKPEAELKVPPLLIARPAELAEKSMSGKYHFYLGSTHAHSGFSGDHASGIAKKNNGVADYSKDQPAELFKKAKATGYDFYFVTDHSSPEQNEFYKNGMTDEHWAMTKKQADEATTPDFVALRGHEFSRNQDPDKGGYGHMNVLNGPDWFSAYAAGHTFVWAYDHIAEQPMTVAQFNHPAMPASGKSAKNFNDYKGRTKERNGGVRLVEIWNSGDKMSYVPVVQRIWALGWKVAPTSGTDVHGQFGIETRRIRTGVLAEALTADGVMRALKDRRVYATLEPKLHLEYTLNGNMMGTALDSRPEGDLKVKVFANDPAGAVLTRIDVHGGKYETNGGDTKVLAAIPFGPDQKTAEATVPNGYDFYYVSVYKEGVHTARAFAAPIWMDNN